MVKRTQVYNELSSEVTNANVDYSSLVQHIGI